jgi:diguanylate cyclase (GGDEF)-like protein
MSQRATLGSHDQRSASFAGGLFSRIPALLSPRGSDRRSANAPEALLLLQSFEAAGHGWFWSTDASGRFTYISDNIAQLLGSSGASPLGSIFADAFTLADEDTTGRRTLPFVFAKHRPFEKLVLTAAAANARRFWSVSGVPRFDRAGKFDGYRGSAIDVTEDRSSSRHATELAQYDELTGLPNRRRMFGVLESSVLAAEHQKRPCAVISIDLDRFKQVNDTLGHPAGDTLLQQVADRLVGIVGGREKVFRLGGDEFQVILQNCDNRGIIGDLATDIIAGLSQPYSVAGSRCNIGASIGIAVAPVDGCTTEDMIRNADLALYASKAGGRGRFQFFSSDLLQAAEDKRAIEEDLRDALENGEISLAYQPIVNAKSNLITGVEALLRWQHPQRGYIAPSLFVPIAEETGLIGHLGTWALRKACEDAISWPGELRVAVNVSPLQFMDESLPAVVMNALASAGLDPGRLELEITEGVFLADTAETETMFSSLKAIGVRLALDDFGTGYSSLGYLRTAPFDKIKIDQSFVRAATQPDSRNGAIIAAIVALAEALEMETTAEGVEYMDQLHLIRNLRVSHAQGWVYSKAISTEELVGRLARGDWQLEPSGPAKLRPERQAVYRKVGVIHGNRYDQGVVRNLSESGALIDGIPGLNLDDLIVVDFGDGQLAFARVTRAQGRQYGVAFEQQLVGDGDGGLCTSHRVSPYVLSTIGLPSADNPDRTGSGEEHTRPLEELAKRLGLTLAPKAQRPAAMTFVRPEEAGEAEPVSPTIRQLSAKFMDCLKEDEPSRESAKRDLRNHVLPRFGQFRLNEVSQADIFAWLAAKVEVEDHPPGTDTRLHHLLNQMWRLAVRLELPGAEPSPFEGQSWSEKRIERDGILTHVEALRLVDAARMSQNRQLKLILSLMLLTGARQGELLKARWEQIDLQKGVWNFATVVPGRPRQLSLSTATVRLIAAIPRLPECPYLIANPKTNQPYRSVLRSWEVARSKAGLPHIEIDDLRFCDLEDPARQERLVQLVLSEGSQPSSTLVEDETHEPFSSSQ